jgi:acetylcholinesterase
MYARLPVTFAKQRGSTTAEVGQYMRSFMLPTAPQSDVDLLLQYYPEDVTVGCPFDTGFLNMLGRPFLRFPT